MKKMKSKFWGLMGALVALCFAPVAVQAVPSFARQTGMSCEACHTAFPELTAMGRSFKASGYSFGVKKVKAKTAEDTKDDIGVSALPPISAMLQASYTIMKSPPDTSATDAGAGADQRGTAVLPQQASLFLAGEVAPDLGTFIQMTYDSSFHFDNSDIRYAHDVDLMGKNLTLGLDMNNNPTVQDLWNSTPAFGFPFVSVDASPFGLVVVVLFRFSFRASERTPSRVLAMLPSGRCVGLGTPAGVLVLAWPPTAGSGAAGMEVV